MNLVGMGKGNMLWKYIFLKKECGKSACGLKLCFGCQNATLVHPSVLRREGIQVFTPSPTKRGMCRVYFIRLRERRPQGIKMGGEGVNKKRGMQRITIRFMKPSTPYTAGIPFIQFCIFISFFFFCFLQKKHKFSNEKSAAPICGNWRSGFFFHDCRRARPPLTGGEEGTFLIGHLAYAGISLRIERSICQKRAWGEWGAGYFSLSRPRNTLSPPQGWSPGILIVGSFKQDKSKYTAPPNYPISLRIWTNYLRQKAKWKEYPAQEEGIPNYERDSFS